MDALPQRRRPAHLPTGESGNRSTIIFLTLCTRDRRPILANPTAHTSILTAWQRASHWLVGRYVLMPDHLHLFCAPGSWPPHSLKRWISYWQNPVIRSWPRPDETPLWQKDYWDRQLRTGESYGAKWQYVIGNPVRHGLATDAAPWPYQGEVNLLRSHDR